ncbi:polyprenyl synthetase family protein [Streptomyces sp. NPDC048248]|uniref:polyprenyl synthetase family protein n=1 Tax=Streptomyces sp. NPDC048248 TaxID=3365523 RepID=UPI0037152FE0
MRTRANESLASLCSAAERSGFGAAPPGPGTAPSGPSRGPGSAGTGAPGACDTLDADAVDADVPGAVDVVLAAVLRERAADAVGIDHTFAADLVERVARFTLSGGKRTRSQFLWWGLRACAGGTTAVEVTAALRIAAGLELVQTCALVHDDVMDGSPLRRGRPAVHADLTAQYGAGSGDGATEPFGRAAAILAGDLALAWADDTVTETDLAPAPRRRVDGIWRAMRTEMVAGQYLDLHNQVTRSRSREQAIRTASLKSGRYSVERPLTLGAALAGADESTGRALGAAGRCAGIAFQLGDDLLGVFGDPDRTGKPSGDDIREGKLTYLVAVARARAEDAGDEAAGALLDRSLGDAGLSDDDVDRVREVLVATGARAAVEAEIGRLAAESARHLDEAGVEPGAGGRLRDLVRAIAGERAAARPCGPGGEGSGEETTVPRTAGGGSR